jgi:NADPH:quinone reductase-like Zn-dependent oxidoreductase
MPPTHMTAAVVEAHGDIEQVQLKSWPVPVPARDEVLVRVRAAALNRADLAIVRGLSGPGLRPIHLPLVPGVDLAGDVVLVGADAAALGWREGDRVVAYPGVFCGRCDWCRQGEETMCDHYQIIGEERDGGFAEYATVPAANLKRVPPHVDLDTAAACPATFTTAWRMLVNRGALTPGDTVLVVGVGSGVSTAAIAIARRVGARVLGTTREEAKVAPALALGAEAVLAGYERPFDEWVRERTDGRGVDVVVDSVGALTWRSSIRSLAKGGKLVICGATSGDNPDFSIRELYQQHRQVLGAPCGNLREFHRVMDLVFAGELAPVIDRRYGLAQVRDAFTRLSSQDQFGKVVVVP